MENRLAPLIISFSLVVTFTSVFALPVMAQQNASAGTVEVGGHVSGAFDLFGPRPITGFRLSATEAVIADAGQRKVQAAFGGGVLVSLSKTLWAYSSFNFYLPEERTARAVRGNAVDQLRRQRRYTTGFGGLQITYPTITRVVPYINVGAGVVHYKEDETETTENIIGLPAQRDASSSVTTAALHFGGGIRIFLGEAWGLRGAAEGFYTKDPLKQALPFLVSLGVPEQSRHGFGQITAGFFKQW